MMRNSFKFIAVALIAFTFASCEKEVINQYGATTIAVPKPGVPIDSTHFNATIIPMLAKYCATCHTSRKPVLTGTTAQTIYDGLISGQDISSVNFVNTTNPEASAIYTKIKAIHKGKPVAVADTLLLWIQQGAKNN